VIKNKIIRFFFFLSICAFFMGPSFGSQSVQTLLDKVEASLEQRDFAAYLDLFVPELRENERAELREKFEELNLESVSVFKTRKRIELENGIRTYLNVVFESTHSVIIEMWRLDMEHASDQWLIGEKRVTRDVRNLYKINIPSGREERVSRVEIKHADIQITFDNPVVFYDNIPDVETALLVIGEGHIRFTPSIEREKHQLRLVYKKDFLQDRLKYVFVRCSDELFESNIRIEKKHEKGNPINQAERNRAYSLFAQHYSRSFTVENSLDGKLYSVIPQEEEAVIEFEGVKIGKFTYIFSPFAEEEITLYQWEKQRFMNMYSPQSASEEKRFFISFGEKYDIQNYAMDIDFNPEDRYISGRAEVAFKSSTGHLDKVKFKLNPNLEILRITDQNNNELFFTKDRLRTNLYVYFLDPIQRNQTATVTIYYRGTILPSPLAEDAISAAQVDDLYLYIPPRSETYLYSLNAQWYPVPPEGDYFTARIKIIIPPDYVVVSNGVLVEESELEQWDRVEDLDEVGRKISVFESRKPIKYMSFIVGKWQTKRSETEPMHLHYYRTLDVILPRVDFFEEAKKILQFYSEKFGPYPYESLSIIHRIWRESGGHSPASFIVLNQLPRIEGIRLERADSPVNLTRWNEYYLAHEIAHQWWGQGVTWDRHHDHWISEGLAQFSSILYLREKYGEAAFSSILKKMSAWTKKKTKWGPIIFGSRISHFDYYAFQSIVYDKSSLALNMLKDLLGDEVFFRGVREFFERNKYKAARTHDFVSSMSAISQQDVAPFFRAWFNSSALPEIMVSHTVEKSPQGFLLKFHIVQTKNLFIFPLWVEWIEDGKKTKKMIVVDKREHNVEFPLSHKPTKIRINPDEAVPGFFR
jgi:hypothetical protein